MPSTYPVLLARPALSECHVLAPDATGRYLWAFRTGVGQVLPVYSFRAPVARPQRAPRPRLSLKRYACWWGVGLAAGCGWLLLATTCFYLLF